MYLVSIRAVTLIHYAATLLLFVFYIFAVFRVILARLNSAQYLLSGFSFHLLL